MVLDQLPFTCSVWLDGDPETFKAPSASMIVKDHWDGIVVLFGDQLMKSMRGIGTLDTLSETWADLLDSIACCPDAIALHSPG